MQYIKKDQQYKNIKKTNINIRDGFKKLCSSATEATVSTNEPCASSGRLSSIFLLIYTNLKKLFLFSDVASIQRNLLKVASIWRNSFPLLLLYVSLEIMAPHCFEFLLKDDKWNLKHTHTKWDLWDLRPFREKDKSLIYCDVRAVLHSCNVFSSSDKKISNIPNDSGGKIYICQILFVSDEHCLCLCWDPIMKCIL